jgi:hypothetical protein
MFRFVSIPTVCLLVALPQPCLAASQPVPAIMTELGCTRTQNLTWAATGYAYIETSLYEFKVILPNLDTDNVHAVVGLSGVYRPSGEGGRINISVDGVPTVTRIDAQTEIATVRLKTDAGDGLFPTHVAFTLFVTEKVGKPPKCSTAPR